MLPEAAEYADRARHLRRVDRVRPRAPRPHGRARDHLQAAPPRPRRAVLDDALRPGRAQTPRPLARPPLGHPPRRHRSARTVRHRRGAAPRRRVHGRRGDRAGPRNSIDAGAIVILATDANPGTSPIFSLPLSSVWPSAATGCPAARRSSPSRSTSAYVLDLQSASARSNPANEPTSCCSTPRAEHMAYRLGTQPGGRDVRRRRTGLRAPGRAVADRGAVSFDRPTRKTPSRSAPPSPWTSSTRASSGPEPSAARANRCPGSRP